MANKYILLVFVAFAIVILGTGLSAQNLESPCPRVFVYEPPGDENDRWYGIVTLITDTDLSGVWLKLIFDNPSLQLGNWFGEVRSRDNKDYLIHNRNHKLPANAPYPLRFYIRYDPNKPVPRLVGFRLNAVEKCPEVQKATAAPPSTELFTNKEVEIATTPMSSQPDVPDVAPISIPNIRGLYETKCGRQSYVKARPLILYGQNTTEGEWPWHTAIYKNHRGSIKYICGGTLIANNYVVTAAHCVANPETGDADRPNKFIVYIGTTSINNFSPNVQIGQVTQIRVHPEYIRENFHNDVALVKLAKPFYYTDSVKPICLWEGTDVLNNVVGSLGTVVGWGFDENNRITEQLAKTQMPIVDTVTCIYSLPDFFSKYTSVNSFCAGYRNGSSVCNGDSGSGMVIPRLDNDKQLTWYLRGLVSVSVPTADKTLCDPYNYIVFTDVAKFNSWIRGIIKFN